MVETEKIYIEFSLKPLFKTFLKYFLPKKILSSPTKNTGNIEILTSESILKKYLTSIIWYGSMVLRLIRLIFRRSHWVLSIFYVQKLDKKLSFGQRRKGVGLFYLERKIKMNLTEMSRLLQRSPATVAAGIKQGVFPFAAATELSGRRSKIIFFPAKVDEYVGSKNEYDLSIKAVAQMMGITPLTLQVFLKKGLLPFGVAFKTNPDNERYVYVIYPVKLEEYLVGKKAA